MLTPEDQCDETMQVNYLSQVYLAHLLKHRMSKSLKPKVIYVACESHRFSTLCSESLTKLDVSPSKAKGYESIIAYNNSKMLGVAFVMEAAERWQNLGIRCFAVHPGNMVSGTRLSRNWWLYRLLFSLVRPFAKSTDQAAASIVFAAFAPEIEDAIGRGVYINNCFPTRPADLALEPAFRSQSWQITKDVLNDKLCKPIDNL